LNEGTRSTEIREGKYREREKICRELTFAVTNPRFSRSSTDAYNWHRPCEGTLGARQNSSPCKSPAVWRCPGGTIDNSPAFQRGVGWPGRASPEGTAENPIRNWHMDGCPQPSLRDGFPWAVGPSVETLGYSHGSLRDKERSEFGDAFGFDCVYETPIYQISKFSAKLRPLRNLYRAQEDYDSLQLRLE